jgi:hypothetical protein
MSLNDKVTVMLKVGDLVPDGSGKITNISEDTGTVAVVSAGRTVILNLEK